MLPAVIFAVYFAFMSGLVGYICWTGRHCPLPEPERLDADPPARETGEDGDTPLAA